MNTGIMVGSIVRVIGHLLVSPYFHLAALLLAAFIANKVLSNQRLGQRLSRWFLGIGVGWFLICSLSVPSQIFIHSLENYHPPIASNDQGVKETNLIVVLASGYYEDETLPKSSRFQDCALKRIMHAIELHKQSGLPIVITGGVILESDTPIADYTAKFMLEQGIEAHNLRIIPLGENTRQESLAVAEQYPGESITLVTSASHMRRAVNYFDAAGFSVLPAPTDYAGTRNINWTLSMPSAESLMRSSDALREYGGLVLQWFELR